MWSVPSFFSACYALRVGGTIVDPDLELVSPVQIAVCPLSTLPGTAIMPNPQVSLYSRGQIARIVRQQTPTDAHSRRDEVPQIPLSEDDGVAVELR